jgi:hypothetical protein
MEIMIWMGGGTKSCAGSLPAKTHRHTAPAAASLRQQVSQEHQCLCCHPVNGPDCGHFRVCKDTFVVHWGWQG